MSLNRSILIGNLRKKFGRRLLERDRRSLRNGLGRVPRRSVCSGQLCLRTFAQHCTGLIRGRRSRLPEHRSAAPDLWPRAGRSACVHAFDQAPAAR
jgi:hypothetical protein